MRTTNRLPHLAALALLALLHVSVARAEDHRALGKEAFGRGDYAAAAEHYLAASRELEGVDREALAQVQIDLGVVYLSGLGRPADALRAFVRAGDLASNPASAWLWASTAALQMGDEAESNRYKRLALGIKKTPSAAADPVPAGSADSAQTPPPQEPAPVPAPSEPAAPAPAAPAAESAKPEPKEPEPVKAETPRLESVKAEPIQEEPANAAPAPVPQKTETTEAPRKEGAFAHFFGAKGETPPPEQAAEEKTGPATKRETPTARNEKAPAASTERKTPKKVDEPSAEKKPDAPASPAAGAAFDHFFKRKPDGEPAKESVDDSASEEPATADEPPPSDGSTPS